MTNIQPKVAPPTEVGAIVGRFQVDGLTPSHSALIDYVRSRHSKVIVLLGCPRFTGDKHDPLDYDTRRLMLQDIYPDIIILPLPDQRENGPWSEKLDETLQIVLGPLQKVTIYGGRDSFIPCYCGKWPTQELAEPDSVYNFSGTAVRERLAINAQTSRGFRAGVIYNAFQQWPKVMTTVDIAIVDFSKNRFLMARKPGERAYRFVGGFSEPKDNSFEVTARREVMEETGVEIGHPIAIGSFNIPDWRLKKKTDVIRTILYVAPYIYGSPEARDDIEEARWFDYTPDVRIDIVPEHNPAFMHFLNASFRTESEYRFILEHLAAKHTSKQETTE